MIRITGKDRQKILSSFKYEREIAPNRFNQFVKKQKMGYSQMFLCEPASISEDRVQLNTYFEENDAKCIKKKAKIEGFEIIVRIYD